MTHTHGHTDTDTQTHTHTHTGIMVDLLKLMSQNIKHLITVYIITFS